MVPIGCATVCTSASQLWTASRLMVRLGPAASVAGALVVAVKAEPIARMARHEPAAMAKAAAMAEDGTAADANKTPTLRNLKALPTAANSSSETAASVLLELSRNGETVR